MPKFAAVNLSKLPPIDACHVDITVLLSEMRSIREQMSLQHTCSCSTDIIKLKKELEQIKLNTQKSYAEVSHVKSPPGILENSSKYELPKPVRNDNDIDNEITFLKQQVASNSISTPMINPVDIDGYKTVSYKKGNRPKPVIGAGNRPKPVIGALKSNVISAVPKRGKVAHIFLSRMDPETSVEEIITHVKGAFDVTPKCEKLKTRYDTYSSFAIECIVEDPACTLNPDKWPEGALIRRYFPPKRINNGPKQD